LSDHFGSAPFFIIYDSEKKTHEAVENGNTAHEHGSCMPVERLTRLGIEAVLCHGMGVRAAALLTSAGIKPFRVEAETVSEAIRKYEAQEVSLLDATNACQHHRCH